FFSRNNKKDLIAKVQPGIAGFVVLTQLLFIPAHTLAAVRNVWPAAASPMVKNIKPNRLVPFAKIAPAFPDFSIQPSDEEISHARVFEEPLIKIGTGNGGAKENQALASALTTYLHSTNSEDVSSLLQF